MKIIFFIVLLVLFFQTKSQLVFWSENFGTGCGTGTQAHNYTTPNGTWTVVNIGANDIYANIWYVSAEENGNGAGNCGSGCGTNRTLHVSSDPSIAGDVGAAYYSGDGGWFGMPSTTSKRVESPFINCTGRSNITLSFVYMEYGQGTTDNATLWYFNGTTWSQLSDPPKTACCGGACNGTRQGRWTSYSIALPASANNNPNVKIGFRWVNNNDMSGYDPSFAVDDIQLSVPNPVPVEILHFDGFYDFNEKSVTLTWSTASEINNDHFEIEYSENGLIYQQIGIVHGNGNSNSYHFYSFKDNESRAAQRYYRLKQVNFDGTFSYIGPIYIDCEFDEPQIQALWNGKNLTLINLPENVESNVKIFSVDGKLLAETKGSGNMVFPLSVNCLFYLIVEQNHQITHVKPKIMSYEK